MCIIAVQLNAAEVSKDRTGRSRHTLSGAVRLTTIATKNQRACIYALHANRISLTSHIHLICKIFLCFSVAAEMDVLARGFIRNHIKWEFVYQLSFICMAFQKSSQPDANDGQRYEFRHERHLSGTIWSF